MRGDFQVYGLAAFLGVLWGVHPHPALIFPTAAFFLFLYPAQWIRRFLILFVGMSFTLYCSVSYRFAEIPEHGVVGVGEFYPSQVSKTAKGEWLARGTLRSFNEGYLRNVPCKALFRYEEEFNSAMTLFGRLSQKESGSYFFHVETSASRPWSISPAKLRYKVKERVKGILEAAFKEDHVKHLLTGLATGEFEDRELSFALGRFGLQHIIAISGFHFALIAASIHFLLGFFFPPRVVMPLLLFALAVYFFYLGFGASIARAWLMASIGILSRILKRKSQILNTLGFVLLVMMIYDPLQAFHLGFQLSFLAVGGIIFLYDSLDCLLKGYCTRQTPSELLNQSLFNKHAYLIVNWVRQGFAMTCAVNALLLPLLLWHFHQFPILSLIFNLFFPPFLTLGIWLTLVAFSLPIVGQWFVPMIEAYFSWLIDLMLYAPNSLDLKITSQSASPLLFSVLLTVSFSAALLIYAVNRRGGLENNSWRYI